MSSHVVSNLSEFFHAIFCTISAVKINLQCEFVTLLYKNISKVQIQGEVKKKLRDSKNFQWIKTGGYKACSN